MLSGLPSPTGPRVVVADCGVCHGSGVVVVYAPVEGVPEVDPCEACGGTGTEFRVEV